MMMLMMAIALPLKFERMMTDRTVVAVTAAAVVLVVATTK